MDPTDASTEAGERVASPLATSRPKRRKREDMEVTSALEHILLDRTDVWTTRILPFLGPGYFLLLASVSRQFRELYEIFFNSLSKLPKVRTGRSGTISIATVRNTFYSAAFSSLSCAKLWYETRAKREYARETRICAAIAAVGNLDVMKWAIKEVGLSSDSSCCSTAALYGHVEMVECLTDRVLVEQQLLWL